MAKAVESQRTLMRIFIGESKRCTDGTHRGKPLYKALLLTLRERGFSGATVVRGISGFGASERIRTGKILRLSLDLPVIVEVVDTEQRIQQILPELELKIGSGLVTLEQVRVVRYRSE